MTAVDFVELARLRRQDELDSAKSQAERNRMGQFATPTVLATDILNHAKSLLPRRSKIRFLDPAFGMGSFYSALLRSFSLSRIAEAKGYEIDPDYGRQAVQLWDDTPLKFTIGDFTRATAPEEDERASLLICNPPYVRHHHLTRHEKARLHRIVEETSGVMLSGLAGLYCYFLCLSHGWMARNGLAIWLIPSEFMDVNYGQAVKKYLLDRVTLLRIHRFQPNDVQFGDALVSSAVVTFREGTPPPNHSVEFSFGGSLARPMIAGSISADVLRGTAKWSRFPLRASEDATGQNRLVLGDLFRIKRGLATGANDFFILSPKQASDHGLPGEFLVPVLPSPRQLVFDEIDGDEMGNPIVRQRLFLLSCSLPEDDVKARYPTLWKYLQTGVHKKIDERYLCKHRSPWYSQEDRPASSLLCTYMGRAGVRDGGPFRFILNHSKATAANVYLMLYPKPALQNALNGRPELVRALWTALNEISGETLKSEGRVYGGGLHKLEPRELARAPADSILNVLPQLIDGPADQLMLV